MSIKDKLSAEEIKRRLKPCATNLHIQCCDEVTSTNNILKERAFGEECALIALSQTAGKGRLGRSFFSPHDTGLYLSVRINASMPPEKLMLLTPAAAVAALKALEKAGACDVQIKWVNDLVLSGRKICGILTEAVHSPDGSASVIVGVGINVYAPEEGFPEDIADIAGYVFRERRQNLRNELASDFINSFMEFVENIDKGEFADIYREKSCVIGKRINVINAGTARPAKAMDIDDECRLLVQYDDGTEEALYSGEISIRVV